MKRERTPALALLGLALALILLIGARAFTRSSESLLEPEAGHQIDVTPEVVMDSAASHQKHPPTAASLPVHPGNRAEDQISVPTTAALTEEVARDPHGVPPSLTRFSSQVAHRLPAARASIEEGRRLLEDLRTWADASENGVIQAYCLSVARDLVTVHSELAAKYADFEASLPSRVRELSQI